MKFFLVCEDDEGNIVSLQEVKNPAVDTIKEFETKERIAKCLQWEQKSTRSQYRMFQEAEGGHFDDLLQVG